MILPGTFRHLSPSGKSCFPLAPPTLQATPHPAPPPSLPKSAWRAFRRRPPRETPRTPSIWAPFQIL